MPLQSAAVAQGWAPGSEDGVCSGRAQEAQSARTAKQRIRNETSEKGTLAGARPAFYRTCVVDTSAKKIIFFLRRRSQGWHPACNAWAWEESMATEVILLVDERSQVREAVARPYREAGARVEAPATCTEAIGFLSHFRPDWILVGEAQVDELLRWLRDHADRVDVPVVLLPDLQLAA